MHATVPIHFIFLHFMDILSNGVRWETLNNSSCGWERQSVGFHNHIKFLGQLNNYRLLREDLCQESVTFRSIIKAQSKLIWNVSLFTKHNIHGSGMLHVICICWCVKNWLETIDYDWRRLRRITRYSLSVFNVDVLVTSNQRNKPFT